MLTEIFCLYSTSVMSAIYKFSFPKNKLTNNVIKLKFYARIKPVQSTVGGVIAGQMNVKTSTEVLSVVL